MDRALSKGSFALSIVWPCKADGLDYDGHMLEQELISGASGFAERLEVRNDLIQRAEDGDAEIKEILELGVNARKGVTAEPAEIDCPSYAQRALSGK